MRSAQIPKPKISRARARTRLCQRRRSRKGERAIMEASFRQKTDAVKERRRLVAGRPSLVNDGRGELHQRLAGLAVLWIGEKRVNARRDKMISIKGIGVTSVSERITEAVEREVRPLGADQVVDRIAVI